MPESASSLLYVQLFAHDEAAAVGRLITAVRARRATLVHHWHVLCQSRLGSNGAVPQQLFTDTYVPRLSRAVECLARGDTADFVASTQALGEHLARAGVPFTAMVVHVNILKESCARALADDDGYASHALVLDSLLCGLLSVAADGYYEAVVTPAAGAVAPMLTGLAHHGPRPAAAPYHGIVGCSRPMQRVFEHVRRVAGSHVPILVLGETGTGKELVARAIHDAGPRRLASFVALNCAALPRDLVESELFGYRRGAFSGALTECLGLFRAATGGTLLLDEITEMGPELQAKLLRVLQEGTVRPVGSVTEEPVDVRIIASSNRDPAAALASGLLRSDLYYRLSGSTLVVPPLRDRREDIPALVEHRLATLNVRAHELMGGPRAITPSALEALEAHPWPGNVRELFNVLDHAFTMCNATHIDVRDLALPLAAPGPAPELPFASPLPTFEESERSLIERTLALTGGNKLRAALRLGISRKKLYAKIARYGLLA